MLPPCTRTGVHPLGQLGCWSTMERLCCSVTHSENLHLLCIAQAVAERACAGTPWMPSLLVLGPAALCDLVLAREPPFQPPTIGHRFEPLSLISKWKHSRSSHLNQVELKINSKAGIDLHILLGFWGSVMEAGSFLIYFYEQNS